MPDRRMFSREIFESTVMMRLGTAFKERALEAQRVWETLILLADDQGRGRLIPEIIRVKAFGCAPDIFSQVACDDILSWIDHIEKQGALARYQIGDEWYFVLTGWYIYQRGPWKGKASKIPDPPPEIKAMIRIPREDGIDMDANPCAIHDAMDANQSRRSEAKGIEAKRTEANRSEKKRSEAKAPRSPSVPSAENALAWDPEAAELAAEIVDKIPTEKHLRWAKRLNYSTENKVAIRTALAALRGADNPARPGAYLQRVYQDEGGSL